MSQQENEEWVRRALASARSDDSVPDNVAARLDHRLAGLRAERPLSSPRRRVGPYVLAAAAVAAVVAIGVPVLKHQDGPSPDVAASSASRGAATPTPSTAPSGSATVGGQARMGLTGDVPRLRTAGFGSGVAAALPQLLEAAQAYALGGDEAASSCRATPAPGTRGALVLLDGRPALVEISTPSGGARTIRALSCGDGSPLATARVAAR